MNNKRFIFKLFILSLFVLISQNNVFSQTADAGSDATICSNSYTLEAMPPPAGWMGTWSVVVGFADIADITNHNTPIINLMSGSNTLRWTITDGVDTNYDEVVITNNSIMALSPMFTDTTLICLDTVHLEISGSTNGSWHIAQGNMAFEDTSFAYTNVWDLSPGVNIARFVEVNGACKDTVDITITQNTIQANAGIDKSICTSTTILTANMPPAGGTGNWSIYEGSGIIVNPNNSNTQVIDIPNMTNKYKWTVTKDGCTRHDIVEISNDSITLSPMFTDTTLICRDTVHLDISGSTNGSWHIAQGNMTFEDEMFAYTNVWGLSHGVNIARFVEVKGACKDTVDITINYNPLWIDAGTDKTICENTIQMQGSFPGNGNSGLWNFIQGGGTIVDNTYKHTFIEDLWNGPNKLVWKVYNGQCQVYDTVTIINDAPSAPQIGFSDSEICTDYFMVNAATPAYGSGTWSISSGFGTFDDASLHSTTVRNLNKGPNTIRWTMTKGACSMFAEKIITNNSIEAFAGEDRAVCGNKATLYAGNIPAGASGTWTLINGTGNIATPNLRLTNVNNLGPTTNTFNWTVTFNNCTSSDQVEIENTSTMPEFDYTVSGNEVTFTNTTTTLNNNYQWDFGNGLYSNKKSPVQTYTAAGIYTVCLTASSIDTINGCTNTMCKDIMVGTVDCQAKFDYTVTSKTVTFNNQSTNAAEYFWEFGNGNVSTNNNAVHNYTSAGIYDVTLTITSDGGCQSTITQTIEVGTIDCSADFDVFVNPETRKVELSNLSSGATEWYWEFGNNKFDTVANTSVTYQKPGEYEICLSAFDANTGCQASKCKKVFIAPDSTQSILDARFSAFVKSADKKVICTNLSLGNPDNLYWTFGDGNMAESANPTHQYQKAGRYEVCLHIFRAATGEVSKKCKEIQIGTLTCDLKPEFEQYIDVKNKTISLFDKSMGEPEVWYWTFGDGQSSTQQNPVHQYKEPGYYLITLSIKKGTEGTCVKHLAKFVQVGQVECKADFDYSVNASNNEIKLVSQSSGDIDKYFWILDDGSYFVDSVVVHQFKNAGKHKIFLSVVDKTGMCMDFVEKEVQVGQITCSAKFNTYIDSTSKTAYFTNEGLGNTSVLYWKFGDGSVATNPNPKHQYEKPGLYLAELMTYNGNTTDICMDYYSQVLLLSSIGDDCEADFFYQIVDETNNTVQFADNSIGENLGYIWSFGDKESSKKAVPEPHSYSKPGVYNACLIVYSQDNPTIRNMNCKKVIIKNTEKELLNANYYYTYDSINNKVAFFDRSVGTPTNWLWTFGDGTTSTDPNPIVSFDKDTFYMVTLEVINADGSVSKFSDVVKSGKTASGLKAAFRSEADTTNAKAGGYPVDFVGAAFGDPAKVEWDFGDGTTDDTNTDVTYTYDEAGTYNACFTVSDPVTGDSDTYCQEVVVGNATNVNAVLNQNASLANYPNPASDMVAIKYSLAAQSHITIEVYDMLGHKIRTIVDMQKAAGTYHYEFTTENLKNGVYFIQMNANGSTFTNKMIISK